METPMSLMRYPLLVTFVLAFAVACGDPADEDAKVEPTFASIDKNIFSKSCATSSCHGSTLAGDLDLRSGAAFSNLVGVDPKNPAAKAAGLKRVTAGDVSKSFLYNKITRPGTGEESPMPLGGEKLSTEKINAIKTWIEKGALK